MAPGSRLEQKLGRKNPEIFRHHFEPQINRQTTVAIIYQDIKIDFAVLDDLAGIAKPFDAFKQRRQQVLDPVRRRKAKAGRF